jgi:hypothetical protein
MPTDLAAALGRREIVRVLRTGDGALARLRCAVIAMRIEGLWAKLRMGVTAAELGALIDGWFEEELDRQFRLFSGAPTPSRPYAPTHRRGLPAGVPGAVPGGGAARLVRG